MSARGGLWSGGSWIRPEKRLAIYERDGWRCAWCGDGSLLSLDHLAGAWDNRPRNLVVACIPCNSRRGETRLSAWLRQLRDEGSDIGAMIAELRRRVAAPVDVARGRALLADPDVAARRQSVGRYVRNEVVNRGGR